MDREKLFKLFNLAKDIQEMGSGEDGFPFVSLNMSNDPLVGAVRIEIMDGGYRSGAPYDGCYVFKNVGRISDRVYRNCVDHLEELKQKAEGFFQ